jgi:hypothetical protein
VVSESGDVPALTRLQIALQAALREFSNEIGKPGSRDVSARVEIDTGAVDRPPQAHSRLKDPLGRNAAES